MNCINCNEIGFIWKINNCLPFILEYDFWHMAAAGAGSDVIQSRGPIFDHFLQHLGRIFWLNDYVNKQNFLEWRYSSSHSWDAVVSRKCDCGTLWADGIIGPFFFKNDTSQNVTVNGDRNRAMNNDFFVPELNRLDAGELWFQQDSSTCHTAHATIVLDLWIGFQDRAI